VDVYNDPQNCGECGRTCPDGHGCADGQCVSCDSPVSVIDVQMSPRPVRLDPNAPNPFNPRTRIRFWLRDAGVVSVRVFDLGGRVVRHVVSDRLYPAGANEVLWDGRGDDGRAVASGVYVCRVRAGGKEASGRMTVLK